MQKKQNILVIIIQHKSNELLISLCKLNISHVIHMTRN